MESLPLGSPKKSHLKWNTHRLRNRNAFISQAQCITVVDVVPASIRLINKIGFRWNNYAVFFPPQSIRSTNTTTGISKRFFYGHALFDEVQIEENSFVANLMHSNTNNYKSSLFQIWFSWKKHFFWIILLVSLKNSLLEYFSFKFDKKCSPESRYLAANNPIIWRNFNFIIHHSITIN